MAYKISEETVIGNEKTVTTQRMYTLKKAFNTGEFEKVGTFYGFDMEMKPHAKLQIPLPNIINEVDK